MNNRFILAALCALCFGSCFFAAAQERKQEPKVVASSPDQETAAEAAESDGSAAAAAANAKPTPRSIEAAERIEGEKRFRANCSRCHQSPHKYPPRVMATALRHMRVRAMITDEDMRLILRYMTQ
jgi:mono/diheme cytochrome c family protein